MALIIIQSAPVYKLILNLKLILSWKFSPSTLVSEIKYMTSGYPISPEQKLDFRLISDEERQIESFLKEHVHTDSFDRFYRFLPSLILYIDFSSTISARVRKVMLNKKKVLELFFKEITPSKKRQWKSFSTDCHNYMTKSQSKEVCFNELRRRQIRKWVEEGICKEFRIDWDRKWLDFIISPASSKFHLLAMNFISRFRMNLFTI